ncbi:DNA-binding helix-turn-helix protein [Leptospira fainei serovar Hurstbridge str. BUT 6]|uniref:DNA-binding helix-turn-helix protein n=1 Tax=Leptospira fainei serovar Hurstbridge str. BUT 6 TaxID=1193011 RepID=S3UX69_9LEPT|nr:helix-turn-helix domain-containing protein [Leptospira fainei]EPG72949.1 DNA-binding helix-turn-helix protein [Leptospira fainei serovar Hurstbridge str. BUT 6]
MTLLVWLANGFILFGGFLAVLLAVNEIFSHSKRAYRFLFSLTLVSVACMQLLSAFGLEIATDNSVNLLPLANIHIPFLFLPAPLAYLTIKTVSEENFSIKRHTILIGFVIFTAVLFYVIYNSPILGLERFPFNTIIAFGDKSILQKWISQTPYFFAGIYSLAFAAKIFGALRQIQDFRVKILLGIFLLDTLIVSALVILGSIFETFFFRLALLAISFVLCLIFVARNRYPNLSESISKELAKVRYVRSRLAGIDSDSLIGRLNALLENEKIYKNDNLSLAGIAKELSLTPHQLSELINQKLNLGFFSLVNRYRVEEAKRLLAQTDKTVLEIAYEVGFNNRSSFNESFLKFAGVTPIVYRRKNKS